MKDRREVSSEAAPEAIGPYAQALLCGDQLFCSGQIGLDPATGQLVEGGLAAEAERVFANLAAVLSEAGMDFRDVVKVTVYLTDIDGFPVLNEIYARHVDEPYPARATVEVSRLPKGAVVEIDLVAIRRV